MSRHVFRAQDYVEHMLEACTRMQTYTAGRSLEQFLSDTLMQDAVVRNLQVLGEASKQLRDVLPNPQDRLPQIPFPVIYGLRNRMIHAYSFINYSTVFELATQDIPVLRAALAATLASWPSDLKPPQTKS